MLDSRESSPKNISEKAESGNCRCFWAEGLCGMDGSMNAPDK